MLHSKRNDIDSKNLMSYTTEVTFTLMLSQHFETRFSPQTTWPNQAVSKQVTGTQIRLVIRMC